MADTEAKNIAKYNRPTKEVEDETNSAYAKAGQRLWDLAKIVAEWPRLLYQQRKQELKNGELPISDEGPKEVKHKEPAPFKPHQYVPIGNRQAWLFCTSAPS